MQQGARATRDKWFSSYKRPHILFAWPFSFEPDSFSCIIVWQTVSRVLQKVIVITWNVLVYACLVFENQNFRGQGKKSAKSCCGWYFQCFCINSLACQNVFFFYRAFYRFKMLPHWTVNIKKEAWNLKKEKSMKFKKREKRLKGNQSSHIFII